jgi:hypothetical protein
MSPTKRKNCAGDRAVVTEESLAHQGLFSAHFLSASDPGAYLRARSIWKKSVSGLRHSLCIKGRGCTRPTTAQVLRAFSHAEHTVQRFEAEFTTHQRQVLDPARRDGKRIRG